MLKSSCIAALAAISMSSAFANWDTDAWMSMPAKKPMLSNLLAAGGGPMFFSSKRVMQLGLGHDRAEEEIKKLEAQFGEGRVYRFFAVGDYMMQDSMRIASLHWDTPFEPQGAFGGFGHDVDSRKAMDDMLGEHLHHLVMENADERFGEGAADNWHTIADQLAKNLGAS